MRTNPIPTINRGTKKAGKGTGLPFAFPSQAAPKVIKTIPNQKTGKIFL
jgi:hypothetical protein